MIRKAIIVVLTTPAIVLTASGTWSYWRPVELVDASRVRVGTEGGVAYLRIYYSCDHILQLRTVRWVGFTWYEQEMILPFVGGCSQTGCYKAPWWLLFCLLSTYPTIAFIHGPVRRWRRRRKGLCVQCAYDLTGNVSGICPECGTRIEQP